MHVTTRENDLEYILYSEKQLEARVEELAKQLTADLGGKRPVMVCILKGASLFFADLCRDMDCDLEMDFIKVSSYGESSRSSGVVKLVKDVDVSISGRHVILVDDIMDSGLTLQHLKRLFSTREPASIRTMVLLEKEGCDRKISPDYCGFACPNEFVVGYGLDYAERYRNLPYIGVLKREVYA